MIYKRLAIDSTDYNESIKAFADTGIIKMWTECAGFYYLEFNPEHESQVRNILKCNRIDVLTVE
jgi:hypothetical protein